jgi:hypothetical protein
MKSCLYLQQHCCPKDCCLQALLLLFLLAPLLQVAKCLKQLAGSRPAAILKKYQYPSLEMAAALHQRARDMISQGFEWTLMYGWPQNPSMAR